MKVLLMRIRRRNWRRQGLPDWLILQLEHALEHPHPLTGEVRKVYRRPAR